MTQFLPPNLLVMFQARPPIPYLPPPDAEKKKPPPYSGVASFLKEFEDPSTVDYSKITVVENKEKKRKRIALEKLAKNEERINKDIAKWDPQADPEVTGDAYKTLFVSRLSYDTSERKLKKEFEEYGPVKRVRLVKDMDGRSRGYAFVEYERERDMRTAYKEGDGRKIDGRRVLVDVERGRTVKGWRPRRFGGGLGGTRIGAPLSNIKYSGREPPSHEAGRRDGGQRGGERDSYRPSDRPREDRRDRGSRGDDRHRDGDRHRDRDRDRDRGDRHRSGDRDRDRDRERRHH